MGCALNIHRESEKTPPYFISRSLVKHCPILIIFGRNIREIYRLESMVLFPTSPNLCFLTHGVY